LHGFGRKRSHGQHTGDYSFGKMLGQHLVPPGWTTEGWLKALPKQGGRWADMARPPTEAFRPESRSPNMLPVQRRQEFPWGASWIAQG
jgi:hypothetical protein